METINCSCHQTGSDSYGDGCQYCSPTCSICDQKLTRENAVIRAEISELKITTNKRNKEVDILAEDIDAQERACEDMERELARLLQGKRRERRRPRSNMSKKTSVIK
jgi:hypothetical protein